MYHACSLRHAHALLIAIQDYDFEGGGSALYIIVCTVLRV